MTKCEFCGAELNGILAHATHPCFANIVKYEPPTDNEVRIKLMEMGAPNSLFEFLGYAIPTEMELMIYRKND